MTEQPEDQLAIAARIAECDWQEVSQSLDSRGYARLHELLPPSACDAMIALVGQPELFRKQIDMGAHAYGEGEYGYFAYPLPDPIQSLRQQLYPQLVPIANAWNERLGIETQFPESLEAFLARCHESDQRRPTPLLLAYREQGHNRMHQDVYGDVAFPLQLTCLLSKPGPQSDFEGGEFLISEGRARMQTRTEVVPLERGDAVIFANALRPVVSVRGFARAQMRHGVSRVRSGRRYALGIIFHDAH